MNKSNSSSQIILERLNLNRKLVKKINFNFTKNSTWYLPIKNSTLETELEGFIVKNQFLQKLTQQPINISAQTTSTLIKNLNLKTQNNSLALNSLLLTKNPCSCNRSNIILNNQQAYRNYIQDENIWKLAFFALAFLVGLISVILILTFSFKILINKFSRKNQEDNYQSKRHFKKSTSLLDFDPDLCASNNYSSNRKKRAYSSPASPYSYDQKNSKNKISVNRRETNSTTSTDCTSTIYSSQNLFNEMIKTNQKPVLNVTKSPNFIYGVTNNAFESDESLKSNLNSKKIEKINSFRKSSVPSSFRPFKNENSRQSSNICYNDKNLKDDQSNKSACENIDNLGVKQCSLKDNDSKKPETETYMAPWKLTSIADDYEALEINTVLGSHSIATNLSPITTFSEVYSETKLTETVNCHNDHSKSNFSSLSSNKIKDFSLLCSNNNELISKSSKITQELEKKLKERRQIMESKSDKFQPKLVEDNSFNPTISLSNLEKKIQMWQNELINKSNKSNLSNSNCVCPCHAHSHNHNSNSKSYEKKANVTRRESKEKIEKDMLHKTSYQNRQINKAKDFKSLDSTNRSKKPKIIIDNASTLPTKRESIRALIENKWVTQNKQKDVLEMHLNTLISSRRSSNCKIEK